MRSLYIYKTIIYSIITSFFAVLALAQTLEKKISVSPEQLNYIEHSSVNTLSCKNNPLFPFQAIDFIWLVNGKEIIDSRGKNEISIAFANNSISNVYFCIAIYNIAAETVFSDASFVDNPPFPQNSINNESLIISTEKDFNFDFTVNNSNDYNIKCPLINPQNKVITPNICTKANKKNTITVFLSANKIKTLVLPITSPEAHLFTKNTLRILLTNKKSVSYKDISITVTMPHSAPTIIGAYAFASNNNSTECVFLAQSEYHITAKMKFISNKSRTNIFSTIARDGILPLLPWKNAKTNNTFFGISSAPSKNTNVMCEILLSDGLLFADKQAKIVSNKTEAMNNLTLDYIKFAENIATEINKTMNKVPAFALQDFQFPAIIKTSKLSISTNSIKPNNTEAITIFDDLFLISRVLPKQGTIITLYNNQRQKNNAPETDNQL